MWYVNRQWVFALCFVLLVASVIPPRFVYADDQPQALKLEGDVEYTHDPSIIKDGDTWYLFGTNNGPERAGELPIRCSQDLRRWKRCG